MGAVAAISYTGMQRRANAIQLIGGESAGFDVDVSLPGVKVLLDYYVYAVCAVAAVWPG